MHAGDVFAPFFAPEEGKDKHNSCSNMQAMQMVIELRRKRLMRRLQDKGSLYDLQGHKKGIHPLLPCYVLRFFHFVYIRVRLSCISDWITFARSNPRRQRDPNKSRLGRLNLPSWISCANAKGKRGYVIRRKNSES